MATHWLLKLDTQDDEEGHILIHVTSRKSDELDLDLLATEGSNVFKGKLRRDDLGLLKAKNYNGKEGEWEAILQYTLLEGKSSAISEEQKQSLEVEASVQDRKGKKLLFITFRNRIDDITQRIGAIELSETSKEINLFEWATLAADKSKAVQGEFSALSLSVNDEKATITRLQFQLADLVEAKAEHDEQMLSRFVTLLNEKKFKVRDQQRLLQTAHVDNGRLKRLRGLLEVGSSRNTTRRTGKRPALEDDSEDDESQAFETQENRRGQRDDEDLDSGRQTTPSSSDAEADDDDELPTRAKKTTTKKASPNFTRKTAPTPASIPPPRALPFAAKNGHNTRSETQPKAPEPPPADDDDEETASEDDEL